MHQETRRNQNPFVGGNTVTRTQARLITVGDRVSLAGVLAIGTITRVDRDPHVPSIGEVEISWSDGEVGALSLDGLAQFRLLPYSR